MQFPEFFSPLLMFQHITHSTLATQQCFNNYHSFQSILFTSPIPHSVVPFICILFYPTTQQFLLKLAWNFFWNLEQVFSLEYSSRNSKPKINLVFLLSLHFFQKPPLCSIIFISFCFCSPFMVKVSNPNGPMLIGDQKRG